MPIRRKKLYRPCKKCGKMFEPTGKFTLTCNKCCPMNRFYKNLLKMSRANERELKKK